MAYGRIQFDIIVPTPIRGHQVHPSRPCLRSHKVPVARVTVLKFTACCRPQAPTKAQCHQNQISAFMFTMPRSRAFSALCGCPTICSKYRCVKKPLTGRVVFCQRFRSLSSVVHHLKPVASVRHGFFFVAHPAFEFTSDRASKFTTQGRDQR